MAAECSQFCRPVRRYAAVQCNGMLPPSTITNGANLIHVERLRLWRALRSVWKRGRAFHEKAGRCQAFVFGPCKFISMFCFARIVGKTWPARTAVKAERSEFIWSLDGGRSRPYRVVPGEGKHRYPRVSNIRLPSVSVAPFHPHSSVSSFALGASWVFSIQPALPPVLATFHCVRRRSVGPGLRRSRRNSASKSQTFLQD